MATSILWLITGGKVKACACVRFSAMTGNYETKPCGLYTWLYEARLLLNQEDYLDSLYSFFFNQLAVAIFLFLFPPSSFNQPDFDLIPIS